MISPFFYSLTLLINSKLSGPLHPLCILKLYVDLFMHQRLRNKIRFFHFDYEFQFLCIAQYSQKSMNMCKSIIFSSIRACWLIVYFISCRHGVKARVCSTEQPSICLEIMNFHFSAFLVSL